PDVVSPDESDSVIDGKDLAVVPAPCPRRQETDREPDDREQQYGDGLRGAEEAWTYDEVRERVVDHVDVHAPFGGGHQCVLEASAHGVGLDDVGLEQDALTRRLDG